MSDESADRADAPPDEPGAGGAAALGGDGDSVGDGQAPRECMACGGSGQVLSNLGGTAAKVTCPWCRGSGVRTTGIDAQQAWADQSASAEAAETQARP